MTMAARSRSLEHDGSSQQIIRARWQLAADHQSTMAARSRSSDHDDNKCACAWLAAASWLRVLLLGFARFAGFAARGAS